MILIRDSKTFYFNCGWSKDISENLKRGSKFTIKSNVSSAGNKMKNKIKQVFFKLEHGNSIHEHKKQKNECTS